LQVPSVPQLVAPWSVHSLSGSVPAAIGPQVPLDPVPFAATLHAWQMPPQGESQHTPSTQ
jgi:hypothetical protein